MKKQIIIDYTKNKDGTFVPFRAVFPESVNRNRLKQDRACQNVQEFISGLDAGFDIFEHIIDRIHNIGGR